MAMLGEKGRTIRKAVEGRVASAHPSRKRSATGFNRSKTPSFDANTIEYWVKEREFIENVMNARFNFMIASVALTIGAIVAARGTWLAPLIALVGVVLVFMLGQAIYRPYARLQICTEALKQMRHPVYLVEKIMDDTTDVYLGEPILHYVGYIFKRWLILFLVVIGSIASPLCTRLDQPSPMPSISVIQVEGGRDGKDGRDGRDGRDWLPDNLQVGDGFK